jgi:diguanylate cyclase (GGDEF)-like protein
MVAEAGTYVLAALVALAAGAGVFAWARRGSRRPAARSAAAQTTEPALDTLTGLPGRSGFDEELREAVHCAEDAGQELTVVYVGIDGFELLNATYGRDAGDGILCAAAQRIGQWRESGLPFARLGGTEFVLALGGGLERARDVVASMLRQMAQPMDVGGRPIRLSCSVGLASYPRHGARPMLVGHAGMAMRAAREGGGGSYAEYEPQMGEDQRDQAELARDLRSAIDHGQLMLYYQPKVDARSLQITGAEALLRWQHPSRGIVSPDVFVPIAERHGLISSIGNWVLEEATRQAGEWRERGLRMRVAVNVSGFQMRQDDFTERLAGLLHRHRLRPERFTCEITETVAMEDTQITQSTFARLGRLGVHVSIDDFGTGHSSLALLRRLPAAELKIDRAFVTDLGRSADALAVAKAVVQLAHTLDLRVVAEGVETELQRDHLLALGCDELQGFLFAKPMPAKSLELWATNESDAPHPSFRASLFSETQTSDFDA